MRFVHAPKACIIDEVCITHAVCITFRKERITQRNLICQVDKSGFFVGGAGETYRAGKACLHLQNIVAVHAAAVLLLVLSSAYASLHLPPAALGNAHSRAFRRARSSLSLQNKKTHPQRMCLLLYKGYEKDIFCGLQ